MSDGGPKIIDLIEDCGGDFRAIDLASAYWLRGDHAEALHHLEIGLGDMFPDLGDLPAKILATHLESEFQIEAAEFKASIRETEESIRRGGRRSTTRFQLPTERKSNGKS